MQINVRDLSFSYGRENVLKDVSLSIGDKELVLLEGANGGGKTTLLKLLMGLLPPKTGEVLINGETPDKALASIGYVPQVYSFNDKFPVSLEEVVATGLLSRRRIFLTKEDKKRVHEVMESVGLSPLANRQSDELSGGQKRKLIIARAIVSCPKVLLLDEPLAHTDQSFQSEFMSLLDKFNENMTIIISSHYGHLLKGRADKSFYVNREVSVS